MEASNGATLSERKRYLAEGRFKPGSMKPKIEAIIAFLEANGRKAMITSPGNMLKTARGETGTIIVN
jgi:carbamate kinase